MAGFFLLEQISTGSRLGWKGGRPSPAKPSTECPEDGSSTRKDRRHPWVSTGRAATSFYFTAHTDTQNTRTALEI
ncbi:hypothetical protein RRG08_038311 [Elysia crispata]|uniref:Uncharacterized protein n=1 Tax=Elysia crispata TaxID=231223 RepID=A0AAE1AMU7_9GAST|nr:hypothetical protein RRG08_038311 [Elysia crispata]